MMPICRGDSLARVLACVVAVSAAMPSLAAPSALPEIQAEMRNRRFDRAVALADKAAKAKDEAADHARYLEATALLLAKKYPEAVVAANRLVKDFPQSDWRHKAVFLAAQALIEQKKFAEAAAIYETESARILSPARKQELVGEILRFAEKLEAKPDPKVPDAPQPNFQKAYSLYTKALATELPREFRDGILLRKARAIQLAGNHGQAINEFQAYLSEYDPTWTGPAGSASERLPMQNPPPAGKHVARARFHLAEAFNQQGNPDAARLELEDLLKMVTAPVKELTPLFAELATAEGRSLPTEIRWLQVQTFFGANPDAVSNVNCTSPPPNMAVANSGAVIGNTGGLPTGDVQLFRLTDGTLDRALDTCRAYLKSHPNGSRAVRVAWMIAEAFQAAGRSDDAVAAYRDFLARKGFGLPDGDAADAMDDEIRATPATHLANLEMRAVFRIGQILAAQKTHDEAIATWQGYVKDYPNGPDWSACQAAIINAEYQLGLDALADKKDDDAMKRFEAFLRAHPLDERAPRILYLFGAVHQAEALDLEEARGDAKTIAENYRKAIDEWAKLVSKYPESDAARAAMLASVRILETKLGEFTKALDLSQKLVRERQDASAAVAIARLTQKSLDVSTDRVFRTNEKPVVKVRLRNIEKAEVRLYRIDLQAYFRKRHAITDVEGLDVSLIQPDKTWTLEPKAYAKYKPFEEEVEIPFTGDEAGAYVVTIGDDDLESTVLVLRSDLEVVVKSSRREVLAFVQDIRTGKPAKDVEILVSSGSAVAATGTTGADGVYRTTLEALEKLGDVRVFALRSRHAAAFNLPLDGLQISSGLASKGYLYTDRPAYLPGERVAMRGVLREVKNGGYVVPQTPDFLVRVTDPQGRLLSEQKVRLGEFGTCDAAIDLPSQAAIGHYTIGASQDSDAAGKAPLQFQGTFEVREFKLEKIKLAMGFPRRVWFRGETIDVTLNAAFAWGEPLATRVIRCTLPDRRIERVTTDAEGNATVSFDTTGMTPGSLLAFSAALDGDNVTTTETVTLARLGFSIAATPSQGVVIAGEPFDVALVTTGADGKPVGEKLAVTVLRMDTPTTSRILTLLPWQQAESPVAAEAKESEIAVQTDPTTGKASVPLTLAKGGMYRMRVSGTDRFGQTITTETQVQVSGDDDATRLRLFANKATLKVGEESNVRLHARLDKGLALVTFEGETILHYRIVALHRGSNDLDVTVGHDLFPNFRLAAAVIDGRDLRTASKEFVVERELKVAVEPVKKAFLPGEKAEVKLTVTDQTGKPVRAEVSLALVNEALYAVCPETTPSILDFFQRNARRFAEFHTGATCGFRYVGTTRPVAKALTDEKQRLVRAEGKAMSLQVQQTQTVDMDGPQDSGGWGAPLASPSKPLIKSGGAVLFSEREAGLAGNLVVDEQQFESRAERIHRAGERGFGGGGGSGHVVPTPRREVRGEGRWLPSIVTDAAGKAVATITMPESTTAWRLTARGCSVETLVGEATAATLTRKDFFVELKTPSFLREGDSLRVVGRVHNLTDFAGTVPLTLHVLDASDPAKTIATREKSVEVTAQGGAEVVFDAVIIPGVLNVTFELAGTAGEHKDSLTETIPVQPWGLPYGVNAGGTATADTAAVLTLPADRPYGSMWMTIAVGPDVKDAVLDMTLGQDGLAGDYARIMPAAYGDSVGNELLSVASALAYANAGTGDSTHSRRLAERARGLVAALVASQAADGSWASGIAGEFTVARTFWALVAARQAGLAVNKDTIDKAAAYLVKQLEGLDANDADGRAIVLHALSTDKRADFAACNRLYRERNNLGAATLAYLTRAFFNIDRAEIAAELATLLEGKAKAEPNQPIVWETGSNRGWQADTSETTALVLLALSESKAKSQRAADAAASLLHTRGCFGFPSGRARGPAIAALASWFARGKEQATDMEIDIEVNGRRIGVVKSVGASGLSMLAVPKDAIASGKNVVELKMRGRGTYTYAATLFGFSSDTKSTGTNVRPLSDPWKYLHAPLEYRGKPIPAGSSSPVKSLEHGQRVSVSVGGHDGTWHHGRWFVMDIPLPAGARLVEGTWRASDNAPIEVHPTFLRIFFQNRCPSVSYELTGYAPGAFRILPCTIREVGNPGFLSVGMTPELTVLAPGEQSPDPYRMNIGERYALGQCHFGDGDDAKALEYLAAVFKENRRYNESELARMLLWIHTKPKHYDAPKIVEMFEILRERYPSLEIPFDRLLVVGKAYRDIGEHERAWLVYRAVIAASFTNDAGISAVLEDEGRFLGSIGFQERIGKEYPDTADVVAATFAISQLLYEKAPKAHELPKEDGVQPEKIAMLGRAVDLLRDFLSRYPTDPLADDAGFSLCNAMLDLKKFDVVVTLSKQLAELHPESELKASFQYMTALGLFWQSQYGEALAAARVVAEGESKDRDFARYILGQIYHAESKPAEAITWYEKVKTLYPDAAEAIRYFEDKRIGLDEVSVVKPGAPVALTLKYRNIKEAFVQVYRVDLMKLYLQQKNLSGITSVQLAGIKPESEITVRLGDGKDYVEKERAVALALEDEAAYLVICRGDDLFTSGMVLITPLTIEIQEEAVGGRVRANVLDTVKGGYRPGVHVKAIGSADSEFRSGETDLRGIYVADGLRGKATVIAREGESRYAFFRGTAWLGTPENAAPQPPQPAARGKDGVDYNQNLYRQNDSIQQFNNRNWDQQRRQAPQKGVQIQKAY
jgi:alpha-2-macroglobulin